MADFKSALKSLGSGEIDVDLMLDKIQAIVGKKPELAPEMLQQIDEAYEQKHIDQDTYHTFTAWVNSNTQSDIDNRDNTKQANPTASIPASPPPTVADENSQTGTSIGESTLDEIGVGYVIRGRFKLIGLIGHGGMGKVYRGIDLLKEEARDKNPYVAIKLMQDSVKNHPEAFMALQRESSRQQRLAHPNIATVYDFDRIGSSGGSVYITMELLEGVPLDSFIRSTVKPAKGLKFESAFKMIKDLGDALTYAHKRDIVHSDFKPANAFFCKDGTVKVLDFGIARAIKRDDVETTLFDPGSFNALTPAYATLEMMDKKDPAPCDDLYALGCVAYELLMGEHPYAKTPANIARNKQMVPPIVKGLSRKQNHALAKAVAFESENRFSSVAEFLDNLLDDSSSKSIKPWAIAAAVSVLLVGAAIVPIMGYLHDRKINGMVEQIKIGGDSYIELFIREQLPSLSAKDKGLITAEVEQSMQTYFESRVEATADPEQGLYDFELLTRLLQDARDIYPSSPWLSELLKKGADIRVAELDVVLRRQMQQLSELSALVDMRDGIVELELLRPDHGLLQLLSAAVKPLIEVQLQRIQTSGNRNDAMAVYSIYGDLFSVLNLNKERNELQLAHISGSERDVAVEKILQGNRERLESLLENADVNDANWLLQVRLNLKQMQSFMGDDAKLSEYFNKIVDVYTPSILEAAAEERFSESGLLLKQVIELAGETPKLLTVLNQVQALQDGYNENIERKTIAKKLSDWKEQLQQQAKQLDLAAAQDTLLRIESELPASDSFLVGDVPKVFEKMYVRLSNDAAKKDDYEGALRLVNEGLQIAVGSTKLEKMIEEFELEISIIQMQAALGSLAAVKVDEVQEVVRRVRTSSPERFSELRAKHAKVYVKEINDTRSSDNTNALKLAEVGVKLFPTANSLVKLRDELKKEVDALLKAEAEKKAEAAAEAAEAAAKAAAVKQAEAVARQDKSSGFAGNALLTAVSVNDKATVIKLMRGGADVNERYTDTGRNAVSEAVILGYEDIVKMLIISGSDINATDNKGNTALHNAVISGRVKLVQMLIDTGVDVNRSNAASKTPLDEAQKIKHEEINKILLAAGALSASAASVSKVEPITYSFAPSEQ